MNIKHHIEELERKVEKIKSEPVKNWIFGITKKIKIKSIQNKIKSLKKKLNNN